MLTANDSSAREVVTPGPWNSRDSFVSETAIKIERLHAKLERLEKQNEQLKSHVSDLLDNADQASRFQSFAESLRNAREAKLDNLHRCMKDMKARFESLETRLGTNERIGSFADVVSELSKLEKRTRWIEHVNLATAATIALVSFTMGSFIAHLVQ